MAKNRTVTINELIPNKVILVKGELTHSRLASHLEGEELEKDNENRRAHGAMPVSKAHTKASVCNAQVHYKDKKNPSPEEIYIEESLYESSRADKYPGKNYSCTNKTKELPYIVVKRAEEAIADRVILEDELASGQKVSLIMRVFKSPNGNNGISLDGLVIHDGPVKYRGAHGRSRDFETLDLSKLVEGSVV